MQLYNYLMEKLPEDVFLNLINTKVYTKGEYLYQPPGMENKVYEIRGGVVRIGNYTQTGEDVCHDFLYSNEVFGNLRYHDVPYMEFAKAMTNIEIITYDLSLYKQYIVHDPLVSEWFNKSLIFYNYRIKNRLISISSLNPLERVLHLFQEFDTTITCPQGKKHWIPDLITDKDIAQLTGLTRQTVSKIQKTLCDVEQGNIFCKKKKNCSSGIHN